MKIYTRKGDDGSTSLWYGGRVPKYAGRTSAYGCIDEAVSTLGLARAKCEDPEVAADILKLQNDLFICGSELATAPEAADRLEAGVSQTTDEMVSWLEERIDNYMGKVDLPPKFVIPGGNELSATLDIARTAVRRAERLVVELADKEEISEILLKFINRVSDFVFALARYTDVPDPELFAGRG